jgi:hypothetical protein
VYSNCIAELRGSVPVRVVGLVGVVAAFRAPASPRE